MGIAAKYIGILAVALAAVGAMAGAVAARRFGPGAYEASAVAAALNWVAGSLAVATISLSRNKPWGVHGALLAMAVRMALPLLALAFFTNSQHALAAHGVAGLIVVHYLVGLALETAMSVRLVAAAPEATAPEATAPTSGSPTNLYAAKSES